MESENTHEKDSQTDWKKRYTDEQAALTKAQQGLKAAEEKAVTAQAKVEEYEEVMGRIGPAVDWNKLEGGEQTPTGDDDPIMTRKEFDNRLAAYTQNMDLLMKFRTDPQYSDLRQHEDMVTGYFQRLRSVTPGSAATVLDKAVKAARKQLTDIETATRAKIDAEQKAKEAEEKERSVKEAEAAGLDSEHGSETPEPRPETPQDYVNRLKAEQEKKSSSF